MPEAAAMPSLAEAMRWVGAEIKGIDGGAVGEVHGVFVDQANGDPAWLIAQVGRRRSARLVAVPLRDCAGAAFGVWVAQEGEVLRTAPVVDPSRPLRREHELTICAHFGIGKEVGRAAEVAGRTEGDITAVPPGS
ncbi:MAG TPA: PRC-barrel domain-containing protein [Solirubrobacterales bacterium]|nr:PRC-barrel domain-containing protein [Solirubrobacterales bacterium]